MNRKWFFITVGISFTLWLTALCALVGTHLQYDGGAPVDKVKKRSRFGGGIPGNSKNLSEQGTAIACDVFSGLQV